MHSNGMWCDVAIAAQTLRWEWVLLRISVLNLFFYFTKCRSWFAVFFSHHFVHATPFSLFKQNSLVCPFAFFFLSIHEIFGVWMLFASIALSFFSRFSLLSFFKCDYVHFWIGNLLILFKHAINAGGFSLQIGYCEWNFSRSTWTPKHSVLFAMAILNPKLYIERKMRKKNTTTKIVDSNRWHGEIKIFVVFSEAIKYRAKERKKNSWQ